MKKAHGMGVLGGLVLTLTVVGPASSQVFTPTYMAPRPASDIGIYLSDGPGDFAIEGILRRNFGGYDLGFRAGLADTPDLSVLIGAELRNPIAVGAPIDLAVTGGVQGLLGDVSAFGVIAGLSIGYTFSSPDFAFTPYVHPRAGLIDGPGDDDSELDLLADIGFDLRFSPSLELRFGVSLDDRGADWGVGLAWR